MSSSGSSLPPHLRAIPPHLRGMMPLPKTSPSSSPEPQHPHRDVPAKTSKLPESKQQPMHNVVQKSPPHLRGMPPNTAELLKPKEDPKYSVVAKTHVQSLDSKNKAVKCDKAITCDKAAKPDMGASLDVKGKAPASSPVVAVASSNSSTSMITPEAKTSTASNKTTPEKIVVADKDIARTGLSSTKVESGISTQAVAASGSSSSNVEPRNISTSNASSASKAESGNNYASTGSSSSKIEPGQKITTDEDLDKTSLNDKANVKKEPQQDDASKNPTEKAETIKADDYVRESGYVSPKSILFGSKDSNPVFDRKANKIGPKPLGLGPTPLKAEPIPLEGDKDALDFFEKYFEHETNATLAVPVERLVSLLDAYRNEKDRLLQATVTLNQQQNQIRFIKHANRNFRCIIERSGMDTTAMWDHAKSKSQDHMDRSLRDPDFTKPEDLDDELWLRDVLAQAGIIVPMDVDEFSLDPENVELTPSEDANQSEISAPRFTPPPGLSEKHRKKVELIMSLAGPDFYKQTSKGIFGPNGELEPIEKPYSPIINPRPAIIEVPDRVGIVQRTHDRPLSPPVFHLKSKKENLKWPAQRVAAEEGAPNGNGNGDTRPAPVHQPQNVHYGKPQHEFYGQKPQNVNNGYARAVTHGGKAQQYNGRAPGAGPDGDQYEITNSAPWVPIDMPECTWDVEPGAAMAYYLSEGNEEMVRALKAKNAQAQKTANPPKARKTKWEKWAMDGEPPMEDIPNEDVPSGGSTKKTRPANGLKKEEPPKANGPQKAAGGNIMASQLVRPREFMDTRHMGVKPQGRTPPKSGSPAKSSYSLPTDDSDRPSVLAEQFRMITIGNLPPDVTHAELAYIIRGGPLLGVRLIVGYPHSRAEIVFVNEHHAVAYYDLMASGAFHFRGLKLSLKLDKGPTIKKAERINLSRQEISRVLIVKPKEIDRNTMLLLRDVAEEVPKKANRSHTHVEVTRLPNKSLQAYRLKFSHLRDSMEAADKFQQMGFQTAFQRDVCVGSLSELPKWREWPDEDVVA